MTFTDYDTMAAYDILSQEMNELVRGIEIEIKDMKSVGHTIHINVYDLNNKQFQELENIAALGDLHRFRDLLRKEKLPAGLYIRRENLQLYDIEQKMGISYSRIIAQTNLRIFYLIYDNLYRFNRRNSNIVIIWENYMNLLFCS